MLSVQVARAILTWGFPEAEQARMQELAAKRQEGELGAAESAELETYRRAGLLLALLQSKARQAIELRS